MADSDNGPDAQLERVLPDLAAFVRRRTYGVVGARESNADLVQSVCREVLEQVAKDRFEFKSDAELRKWLFTAAQHKIQHRRRYWRAERRDPERERTEPCDPRTQLTPSRDAAAREELARLERALDDLPARDLEIVRLAQFEGRSHAEIAERVGVTEAYSRVLLSRALARLATLTAGDPDESA